MSRTPIECEARLVGLSKQRRKDGDWVEVKFHIHPDDHPAALFILPLGTQCMLGVKGLPEKPSEAPKETPESTEGWSEAKRKMVQRSGIVRKEAAFHRFLQHLDAPLWSHISKFVRGDEQIATACIHRWCTVNSCRDLEPGAFTGERFIELIRGYEAFQHGDTDEARLAQRDRT